MKQFTLKPKLLWGITLALLSLIAITTIEIRGAKDLYYGNEAKQNSFLLHDTSSVKEASSESAFGEPSVKEKSQRAGIVESLKGYRKSKDNILFDSEKYVLDLISADQQIVQKVSEYLQDTRELRNLPEGISAVRDQPEAILSRISAIDLAEGIMRQQMDLEKAQEAKMLLSSIVLDSKPILEEGSKTQVARFVKAEKFDAMVAIARNDKNLSIELLRKVGSPKMRESLKRAITAGLVDSGMSRDDAVSFVLNL